MPEVSIGNVDMYLSSEKYYQKLLGKLFKK